jgi:hypothetical protein
MMPQPPSVKAATEEIMQHMATLAPVKNMPHPPGPGGQGGVGGSYAAGPLSDAISSSLERKFSLRHNTAIIIFLWEGKEGSDSNAMEKAKAKVSKQLSPPTTRNLTLRNSWSRGSVGGI